MRHALVDITFFSLIALQKIIHLRNQYSVRQDRSEMNDSTILYIFPVSFTIFYNYVFDITAFSVFKCPRTVQLFMFDITNCCEF